MRHLVDLLAAVALLAWGTQMVRDGVMRVYGAKLRGLLCGAAPNTAAFIFLGGVASVLVQSSNAASLIVASFVQEGLLPLSMALAALLGANVGTAVTALLLSLDLSWMPPLCLLSGTVMHVCWRGTDRARLGRAVIGLGLMLLALRLIGTAVNALAGAPALPLALNSLQGDVLLQITIGALLTLVSYSSVAIVLLVAAFAASGAIGVDVSLGLVLGSNLGTAVAALLTSGKAAVPVRRVLLGNLLFKCAAIPAFVPLAGAWAHATNGSFDTASAVVMFHLAFNSGVALLGVVFLGKASRWMLLLLPDSPITTQRSRPVHLDEAALAAPSLAISCAARAAMHQADVVETMLQGLVRVIENDDAQLAGKLRSLEDSVDEVCTAVKAYLMRIRQDELLDKESERWRDILHFTINMEQIADVVEEVLQDVEKKKIRTGRSFSAEGLAEIVELHRMLMQNLRLSVAVFLTGSRDDAHRLLHEKARFGTLVQTSSLRHLHRLSVKALHTVETSSLHLDLINNLKRINSQLTATAYSVLHRPVPSIRLA